MLTNLNVVGPNSTGCSDGHKRQTYFPQSFDINKRFEDQTSHPGPVNLACSPGPFPVNQTDLHTMKHNSVLYPFHSLDTYSFPYVLHKIFDVELFLVHLWVSYFGGISK